MASISGSSSAARSSSRRPRSFSAPTTALLAVVAAISTIGAYTTGDPRVRFYADDPIWTDDDAVLDASATVKVEDAGSYDFLVNTFASPGERKSVRALNVNTLDEVPDSSWFTNRIGRAEIPLTDLQRGPDRLNTVSLSGWIVSGGKGTGVQPGFRMTTPEGETYQIEFDPPSNPEMATGAEIIGTAFYHAFGYNTVEVYLTELDPDQIVISDKATIFDPLVGRKRRLARRDIDQVFKLAARQPNGKYRVLASRFAEGKPLGNFRYYNTRPDDPNDIVAHEHRRELRAARVFGAWLNHDDSRGVNSLDMLVKRGDRSFVKHYMFDFGSILGSGTIHAQRHRPGNEYILEWKPGWLTLATLGIYTRPWMHIDYPPVPSSVGRFEGEAFDPEAWKPEYPNPAFMNMRPDDAFWAARIVARFSDDAIRTIVGKAQYSDPHAANYIVQTLITRRDKVLKHWLTSVNPLVDFVLSEQGVLRFVNAAVHTGVAKGGSPYKVQWASFDNANGIASEVETASADTTRLQAPASLIAKGGPDFIQVRIAATHPDYPSWATPVTVHFRRVGDGWKTVGIMRGEGGM